MTRIIAGRHKGRVLRAPKGGATRPTGARVKQTLFDILAPRMPGARVVDAFAGSGGVGFEALSRGAARVVLIDCSAAAYATLKQNAELLRGGGGEIELHRQDARVALAALADQGARFDLVYLDPPYESDLYEELLRQIAELDLLLEDGLVVAEHFHKRALPETMGRLRRTRTVRVGDHTLSFYRRGDA